MNTGSIFKRGATTGNTVAGIYAGRVRFDFSLRGRLQGFLDARLLPNRLNEFDLPSQDLIADHMLLINLAPDAGPSNDSDLEILDAGVRHLFSPGAWTPAILRLGTSRCLLDRTPAQVG